MICRYTCIKKAGSHFYHIRQQQVYRKLFSPIHYQQSYYSSSSAKQNPSIHNTHDHYNAPNIKHPDVGSYYIYFKNTNPYVLSHKLCLYAVKYLDLQLSNAIHTNFIDFKQLSIKIFPLLITKDFMLSLLVADLILKHKDFSVDDYPFLKPKQIHTNNSAQLASNSNKTIPSTLVTALTENHNSSLFSEKSDSSQLHSEPPTLPIDKTLKFNLFVLLSSLFLKCSFKNRDYSAILAEENPHILKLSSFITLNGIVQTAISKYFNDFQYFSSPEISVDSYNPNLNINISTSKNQLVNTDLTQNFMSLIDVDCFVQFILISAKKKITISRKLFAVIVKIALLTKNLEKIFFLYASDLFPMGFSPIELKNLRNFRMIAITLRNPVHKNVIDSFLTNKDIHKAVTVARLTQKEEIWSYMLQFYVGKFGIDDNFFELIKFKIIDLKYKESIFQKKENKFKNDVSLIQKDFHYNVVSALVNHAYTLQSQNSLEFEPHYTQRSFDSNLQKPEYFVQQAYNAHLELIRFIKPHSKHALDILVRALVVISNDIDSAYDICQNVFRNSSSNDKSINIDFMLSYLAYGYSLNRNFNQLVALTQFVEAQNIKPDCVYYDILIRTLLMCQNYAPNYIRDKINNTSLTKAEIFPNIFRISSALTLFAKMEIDKIPRTAHTYFALIRDLARNGYVQKVRSLFIMLSNEEKYWSQKRQKYIQILSSNLKDFDSNPSKLDLSCIATDPIYEYIKHNNYILQNTSFYLLGPESKYISELLKFQKESKKRSLLRKLKISLNCRVTIRTYDILMYSYSRNKLYPNVIEVWDHASRNFFVNFKLHPDAPNKALLLESQKILQGLTAELNYNIISWSNMASKAILASIQSNNNNKGLRLLLEYQKIVSLIQKFAKKLNISLDLVYKASLTNAITCLHLQNHSMIRALNFIRMNSPQLYTAISKRLNLSIFLVEDSRKRQHDKSGFLSSRSIFSPNSHRVLPKDVPNLYTRFDFQNSDSKSDFLEYSTSLSNISNIEVSKFKKGLVQLAIYFGKFGYLDYSISLVKFLFESKCPPTPYICRFLIAKMSSKIKNHFEFINCIGQKRDSLLEFSFTNKIKANNFANSKSYNRGNAEVNDLNNRNFEFLRMCQDLIVIYEYWRENEKIKLENYIKANESLIQNTSNVVSDDKSQLANKNASINTTKQFNLQTNIKTLDDVNQYSEYLPIDDNVDKYIHSSVKNLPDIGSSLSSILKYIGSTDNNTKASSVGSYMLPSETMKIVAHAYLYFGEHYNSTVIYLLNIKMQLLKKYNAVSDIDSSHYTRNIKHNRSISEDLSQTLFYLQSCSSPKNERYFYHRFPQNIISILEDVNKVIRYYSEKAATEISLNKNIRPETKTTFDKSFEEFKDSNIPNCVDYNLSDENEIFKKVWDWVIPDQ
ncbi:hypothetical protein BB561_002781 [Smittium simulii]|uniref:Uncharacterized protein n=1 Tax=Smittium simulii TaxID=133385 RepID=A0A2T9YP04_9FUNG|nr:hypothetical protein BB561_002781 [Smittium simulii]